MAKVTEHGIIFNNKLHLIKLILFITQVNTNPMISQVGYLQVVGKQQKKCFFLTLFVDKLTILTSLNDIFFCKFIQSTFLRIYVTNDFFFFSNC